MKKHVGKGLAILLALTSLACSSKSPEKTENTDSTRQFASEAIDLNFRVTGVLADTVAWDEGFLHINMGSSWDAGPGTNRIFQCGTALAEPLQCAHAPATGGFETDVYHPYPEHFDDQFSITTPRHFIKTKTVNPAEGTASIDVLLEFSSSGSGGHFPNSTGQFTVDIDLATGATEPRNAAFGVCGFRHNGVLSGLCTSERQCGGTGQPACTEECALLHAGWELCYKVDRCAQVDTTCDDFDDDCDGDTDEDYVETTTYCAEAGACRAKGEKTCQPGGIEQDSCVPAAVIDFTGSTCPPAPSTFTTEGMNDADRDGIPDLWEQDGFDSNCDGDVTDAVDLPFHVWGANPLHKDLFLEFDWMTGQEPRRGTIQAIKQAFANAPVDTGGFPNPDGCPSTIPAPMSCPGVHLFIDTGGLTDPSASEDGAGLGTCGDGVDNGLLATPPQIADGADATDSDCQVGDNLGGGNGLAPQSVSRIDSRFAAMKCANFNPIRTRFFRYGISARPPSQDPNLSEDGAGPGTCNDGIDNSADGFDAADPDCMAGGPMLEDGSTSPTSCTDFMDNGADGAGDLADPDCGVDPGNTEDGGPPGSCTNGIDEGTDGADGADPDCNYFAGITDGNTGFLDFNHTGGTIMHELGHMLGLGHGGPYTLSDGTPFVGDAQDRKPNHLSIMTGSNSGGIRLRASEDSVSIANSCFDGIDNGGDGLIDASDPNCQVGQDVQGPAGFSDGILDGIILDYSPPLRPDGMRVALPWLYEGALSEATALDLLDSRHLFRYQGFVPSAPEDGLNSCGDGIDNGGDGGNDATDTDCFVGLVFSQWLPEDGLSFCNDGLDNGTLATSPQAADGADGGDTNCRQPFINALDGNNDGLGGTDALAVDWVRDGLLATSAVAVDINGDPDNPNNPPTPETLLGTDEWRNLKIPPPGLAGAQTFHEPTIRQAEALVREERGTDLGISFDELPTGIGVGQPVAVRVAVTNLGPRPAAEYTAALRLPPGVTLDDPNCSQVGSRVECSRSNLGVRAADVFTVWIRIGTNPVNAVRTLAAEVEVVDAENLNAANNLFGRLLVEPTVTCDPQAPFEAPVAAFTGSMDADGLTFSADGQTAYISGAGPGNRDIYVATRTPSGTFGPPALVGPLNTPSIERAPSLSPDGKLYFTKLTNNWEIGRAVGTPPFTGAEVVPAPISSQWQDEDPFWWGNNTLYFVSEVDNGGAHRDIWVAMLDGTTFSPPTKVQGQNLNSNTEEFRPILSPDGLTLYFASKRHGIGNDTQGDVWMARRPSTSAAFLQPVNLWGMNSTGTEFPVTITANGCTLYFASNEETGLGASTNLRLYQATRGTSIPAQVTLRLNILGQGSVTQGGFNCGPGNTGTCSVSAPPDTTMILMASGPAQWTGSCTGNGGTPSTDGVVVFSQNAVCTIKFPDAPLVGPGGLCSLPMDCQNGLRCVNNTCGS
jgi:hypothetical protein